MWLPRFICPECHAALEDRNPDRLARLVCAACGRSYSCRDGVWQFLAAERATVLAPFMSQFRDVREREGRRRTAATYYRALPVVPEQDPDAGEWRIRQESYRHLLGHVFAAGKQP